MIFVQRNRNRLLIHCSRNIRKSDTLPFLAFHTAHWFVLDGASAQTSFHFSLEKDNQLIRDGQLSPASSWPLCWTCSSERGWCLQTCSERRTSLRPTLSPAAIRSPDPLPLDPSEHTSSGPWTDLASPARRLFSGWHLTSGGSRLDVVSGGRLLDQCHVSTRTDACSQKWHLPKYKNCFWRRRAVHRTSRKRVAARNLAGSIDRIPGERMTW